MANSDGTSQMLLTAHDINFINEDFIRRDTIWFTDKNELGETKIVRLSSLGLHKNLSPYNAYKQGKLVKLPVCLFDMDMMIQFLLEMKLYQQAKRKYNAKKYALFSLLN